MDYERTYGKEPVKTKKPTKAPVQKHQLKKTPPSKPSHVSVVRNELQPSEKKRYPPNMSNPYRSLHTAPASNTKVSERKHHRNNLTTTNNNTKSQGYKGMNNHKNYPNTKTYYNHNSKQVKRFRPNNIYRDEQTTFIGRGVRNHF